MMRDDVCVFIREEYGVEADFPWEGDPVDCVFRHRVTEKWFGLMMRIPGDRLGLETADPLDILTLKCDSATIGSLLGQPGFHRAYHMNKEHWITLRLDGSVPLEEVQRLIDFSHALTEPKNPRGGRRKRKKEPEEENEQKEQKKQGGETA